MNFDLYKIIFAMKNNIWILYIIIYPGIHNVGQALYMYVYIS